MTDKQIIKKFSDNHCLVLENNQISLRENEFTAYRIVLGKNTNELLEFVKDTYLQLKHKEQECDMWKNLTVDNGAVALKYQQQLDQLKKANEEKNELLAKLGCPTIATARMKAFTLQQQLEAYKMEAEEGKEINAELKAENEELKRLIAKQKNAKIQLSKLKDKQYKEFCDMKQTLAEIKKVCNSVENIENVNSLYDAKLSGMYLQAKQILQKISKVMPDEN